MGGFVRSGRATPTTAISSLASFLCRLSFRRLSSLLIVALFWRDEGCTSVIHDVSGRRLPPLPHPRLIFFAAASFASEQMESMYCGHHDCYDILKLPRSASPMEIRKAYRAISRTHHPDKNRRRDPEEAQAEFQKINRAYEVLGTPAVREAYDYYLDHPDDLYALYYGIRAVYPQKTNPLFVIFLLLSFVSLGQYVNSRYQYNNFFSGIRQSPQFQRAVQDEITKEFGNKFKKLQAEQQSAARVKIEQIILSERVQVNDGDAIPEPISWTDMYIVQTALLPLSCYSYLKHSAWWIWKFHLLGDDYGNEEMEYLTKKRAKIADSKWSTMPEEERQKLLRQQLWIKKNYEAYWQEQAEMDRDKRVNNTRYRQWKRWKKKNPDTSYMMED